MESGLPVPPARMPLVRGGRPLKAWTWIGAFGPELMLCAARVRIGVMPVAWWAVWDRTSGRMIERSARGSGGIEISPAHLRIRGRAVRADLTLGDGAPVEVVSPHGREHIWTRKRAGVSARGTVELHGARRSVALRAVIDESAGYHARHTAWRWSAGVGTAASGPAVAWNLVDGVHDGEPSERAVWIDGEPHAVAPVSFADDLSRVGELVFTPEAARARRENLLVVSSDYEAPFGAFAGTLPVAGPLREGFGVMERHDVRW
jgi:hypothetical protein